MADFSRSFNRNQASSAILSKKLSNVHSFTGKSIYDDVFTAPPKFGAPTFSSRVEDYSEIFGSSHSSRPSSVPVLELPAIDKREVSVDVQSSEFDYSKIFGGFGDVEVAASYEELITKPKDGDFSSEESWTPVKTGSPTEEADLSKCPGENRMSSHEGSYQSIDGTKQFNMSYHRTKDGTNGTTYIAQLHAVPGFTCLIDEVTPLQKTVGNKPVPSINAGSPTMDIGKGIIEGKHCRKATPNLHGANGKIFEEDIKFQTGCGWDGSNLNDTLFHANEMGLKDRSKVTRPSNLAPNLSNGNSASKRVMTSKSKSSKSDTFEGAAGDCSPTYFDEEIDMNSAAAASAAAVKKAIEEAQAMLRIAKELMERKKEGLQSRFEQSYKDGLKVMKRREVKIADEPNRFKEKMAEVMRERQNTAMQDLSGTEKQNATRTGEVAPNFKDWKKCYFAKEAVGETDGKENETNPVNCKWEGREWEAAKESCEFVNTGNCIEEAVGFKQVDAKKKMMQPTDECEREKWKTTEETFEVPELNGKKLTAVEGVLERGEFEGKLNSVNGEQEWEEDAHKLKSAEEIHKPEESETKLNVAREQEGIEEKLTASQEQERCEKKLKESQEPIGNEWKFEAQKWVENKNKKRLEEAQKQLEFEMEQREAHEREENEKRLKEVLKREENEKRLQEVHDREENEKRLQEVREREENEKRLQEVREREENEKRLQEVREREENEKRLKELYEQGEYEKRLKEACEWVEYEKKANEPGGWAENEMKQKDAHTGEGYEKGLDKVHEEEIRLDDPHEREDWENTLKKECEWVGYEKVEEVQKQEENDKMLKEVYQIEGNERKAKEAFGLEDTERILVETHQREENKNKMKATQEALRCAEQNHQEIYDACNQGGSEGLRWTQEASSIKKNNNDMEVTQEVLAGEGNWRMGKTTTASFGPEDNEEELKAVKVTIELEEKEIVGTACWVQGALEHDKIENNMKDESETFIFEDNGANEPEENEEESRTVKLVNELKDKKIFESDCLAKDVLEHNEIENHMKDECEALLSDEVWVNLDETSMNIGEKQTDKNKKDSRSARYLEKHVEKLAHEVSGDNENQEEAEIALDLVEEKNNCKAAYEEKQWIDNGKKMEASQLNSVFERKRKTWVIPQEIKISQSSEQTKESLDECEALLSDEVWVNLDEASMNDGEKQTDKNKKDSRSACNVGKYVEKFAYEVSGDNMNQKEIEIAFDQVEEKNNFKAAYGEKQWVDNGKKMEASQLNGVFERKRKTWEIPQEIKISQSTERTKENLDETLTIEEREAKETVQKEVELEKEREREREREKIAVERAIREARERAFAEARERAERAAVERATVESRPRGKTGARERLEKASVEVKDKSIAGKVSMEAKLKAERAAVERATMEARKRALEKALAEKAAIGAREQAENFVAEKFSGSCSDNGVRRNFSSSDPQYQGSGPSSSSRYSNSSNYSATERFDGGARSESTQRGKARLEKHQQIVERAAKALAEKNKRDLLAQKEQAERNRLAEALDADVKRWSSGKAGNLRALLSTLQYILGPDSGWQLIPLTDIVTNSAVKKAYRKATLFVHPDKLQQRGASIQQKYICEKVFDLLKEAWNKFSSEER